MSRVSITPIGDVFIRDFDNGIYLTLGAVIVGNRYYLPVNKIRNSKIVPPLFGEFDDVNMVGQQMPGIPFIYGNPSDSVTRYSIPCIRVKREDPSPAMERWQSVHLKYRVPASGESLVTLEYGNRTLTGYGKYEEQVGAITTDIPYTVTIEAGGKSARSNANDLLKYCMKILWPHGKLKVVDSLGYERKYQCYVEGPSDLTSAADIRDRTVIYALSIRVQGELDLNDPYLTQAVTHVPEVNTHSIEEFEV